MVNFLSFVWMLTSIFLMLVILIQRGRGGGLAGAFGAVGGSSAFGTRAGDTMTKITVGVFLFWLIQAGILVKLMGMSRLQGELGKLGGAVESKKSDGDDLGPPIVPAEGKDGKSDDKTVPNADSLKSEPPTATKAPVPPPPVIPAKEATQEPKPTADSKKPAEVPKAGSATKSPPAKDAKQK